MVCYGPGDVPAFYMLIFIFIFITDWHKSKDGPYLSLFIEFYYTIQSIHTVYKANNLTVVSICCAKPHITQAYWV